MRLRLVLPAAVLPLLLLSGCTAASPGATTSPTETIAPDPTPSAEPAGLLACADLVPDGVLAAALTGEADSAPVVVPARQPSLDLVDLAVAPAGGLDCSWRTGQPEGNPAAYRDGDDWTYLTVRVLPGAGSGWNAMHFGDAPVDGRLDVDGISSAASCGDPGCAISAPVGDAWVQVEMHSFAFSIGGSPYGSMPTEDILAELQPAAAAAFGAVLAASPGELAFDAVDGAVAAECDGALDPAGIGAALEDPDFGYQEIDSGTLSPLYLSGYAATRAGMFDCYGSDGDTIITVGRNLADTLASALTEPDYAEALEPVALEGAAGGEVAVQACSDSSSFCSVLFTLGGTAYQVATPRGAVAVAEAMIAQAR